MNDKLRSKYLKEFIEEITYHNRNPRDLKALELMEDDTTNPIIRIRENVQLYRSRIIKDKSKINKVPGFFGYDSCESFVPPKEKTTDMRANYRYIPYLYCANHPYLSLVEVRPRLGAYVSIATIVTKEELTLLDFTNSNKPPRMTDAKGNLFTDLSGLFSKPVADEDDIKDYIPTQFIAEYAKNLGYDGIVYQSSLVPEINSNNLNIFNVVVFNYSKCNPFKSNVVQISNNHVEGAQVDDDTEKLEIAPFIAEQLAKI